jgi:diaminopimelate epimerase
MLIPFAKYQGAGNDFIVIDDLQLKFPIADQEFIIHLCQHRLGVGADGVILLQPSEKADFQMRIFNSDGWEAEQCGNGLRCLVDFIRQNYRTATSLSIQTADRVVSCSWQGDQICVDLGPYAWIHPHFSLEVIHTGVPHVVAFVEDLAIPDFKSIAAGLRSHPDLSSEGANVNFALIQDGKVYIRTYERGVEDETLACGTGAAATAIAAMKKYQLKNPIRVIPASEEELQVDVFPEKVHLTGRAALVFIGSVDYRSLT